MTTPNKSEGAEWEREFDAVPCIACGCYDHDCENRTYDPKDLKAFIAHQRQQAYTEGYKQGSFDQEADLELGVVRQQAVAEFAREVLHLIQEGEFQKATELMEAKQRGIDLTN